MPGVSKSTSGLIYQLHPLVLINVSDHHTRVKAQHGGAERLIGGLLGVQTGRVVEITNSFELMTTGSGGELAVDLPFLRTKQEQCALSHVDSEIYSNTVSHVLRGKPCCPCMCVLYYELWLSLKWAISSDVKLDSSKTSLRCATALCFHKALCHLWTEGFIFYSLDLYTNTHQNPSHCRVMDAWVCAHEYGTIQRNLRRFISARFWIDYYTIYFLLINHEYRQNACQFPRCCNREGYYALCCDVRSHGSRVSTCISTFVSNKYLCIMFCKINMWVFCSHISTLSHHEYLKW